MKTRAAKGGEVGANGEEYKGGQFINTIAENPKKEGSTPRKARKVEVAPYKWEFAPAGAVSIYSQIAGVFGKVVNGVMTIDTSAKTLAYYGRTIEEVQAMADRWNAGERFV